MILWKKTVHDKLVTNVNANDPNRLVLRTQYNTDNLSLEQQTDDASNKTPDASELVKRTYYNATNQGGWW